MPKQLDLPLVAGCNVAHHVPSLLKTKLLFYYNNNKKNKNNKNSSSWKKVEMWHPSLFVSVLKEQTRFQAVGGAASCCVRVQTAAEQRLLSDVCLFFGSGVFTVNVTEAAAVVLSAGNLIFVIIAVLFVFVLGLYLFVFFPLTRQKVEIPSLFLF